MSDGTTDEGRPQVAVLGGGVMGETVVSALLQAGWSPEDVDVTELYAVRANELAERYGVRSCDANAKVAKRADVLVIAVKPNVVADVLAEVSPSLRPGTLVVSIAAGLPISFYESRLPEGTPVVRVMPNTPAVVGRGVSAISPGTHADADHLALTRHILSATGVVVEVPEKDLDAVTAISGSGPAYAFYLIDAMAEAGVLLGLTRELATTLAVGTVQGAATLAQERGEHPVVLRERVSSPGGTTVAAVRELDAHGVRAGIVAAAEAARDRSRELGAEYAG
ncbi:pyrroline-5-carboxylate reductase [Cellulomonas sp. P22]|uniref:pyrroline-5-carboxylate reductase n=1 Tax=Cellulomonas sp. P22 TaxID=3373189 RepID=UPI00379E33D1